MAERVTSETPETDAMLNQVLANVEAIPCGDEHLSKRQLKSILEGVIFPIVAHARSLERRLHASESARREAEAQMWRLHGGVNEEGQRADEAEHKVAILTGELTQAKKHANEQFTQRCKEHDARVEAEKRLEEVDVRDLDQPAVRFYERDFYVLSNFSAFAVHWRSHLFATSEHAYHWAKFAGDGDARATHRANILSILSAHEAFKYAERHRADRRSDWDEVKVSEMRDILHAKAGQHEYVSRKLLQTGDRLLIEDSWRDDFWGWGPNRDGKNMLGKLWMEIRDGMRAARESNVESPS